MPEPQTPIQQVIRNYTTNLPPFPPQGSSFLWLHERIEGSSRRLFARRITMRNFNTNGYSSRSSALKIPAVFRNCWP